ncbi:MAG: transposase, partial [Vulcanimicrobiaceae bacterium]
LEYRCSCPDYVKGSEDCIHVVADRIVREDLVIDGTVIPERETLALAERRPARKVIAWNGLSKKTTDRHAREAMFHRIPELIASLANRIEAGAPGGASSSRGRPTADSQRAAMLLHKACAGVSANEIRAPLQSFLDDDLLRRPTGRAPCANTISRWMNDRAVTTVLFAMLELMAQTARRRERAVIVDSTKLSQMRTAHSRGVFYLGDDRPQATWMKAHAIVGVETKMALGVLFSDSRRHDINYVIPLADQILRVFPARFLLGDKAYLSADVISELEARGIRAVIPLKKGWGKDPKSAFTQAAADLIKWYALSPAEVYEISRLRGLVEAYFSSLKRMADGYCWSRGRPRKEAADDEPVVAWQNEALCKILYANLRQTVILEHETGVVIDYHLAPDRVFPEPADPLISAA